MTPSVFYVKGWVDRLLEKIDSCFNVDLSKRGTESKSPGDTTHSIISVNDSLTASCIQKKRIPHENLSCFPVLIKLKNHVFWQRDQPCCDLSEFKCFTCQAQCEIMT